MTYKDLIPEYAKFALIKNQSTPLPEYSVREIDTRSFVILENFEEAKSLIAEWLQSGIEVFNTQEDFDKKYPLISPQERLARSRIFWWTSISQEEWPQDLLDYFKNDPYWQAFRQIENLPAIDIHTDDLI